jgi:hypothetical protein
VVGVAVAAPFLITIVGYGIWWLLLQAWTRITQTVERSPEDSDARA